MSQLDALQLAAALRERVVEFAADATFVRDERLARITRQLWAGPPEEGGLLSDLWVEGAFPAKLSDSSLATLVEQGRFSTALCEQLHHTGAMPRDRTLYTHQAEALKLARQSTPSGGRPALVVTAGTGTGKTEAFLLPILDDLFSQSRDPGLPGARCFILYPMNALVNDQVDRLSTWLQGQNQVTFVHFTSETPEDKQRADREGVPVTDICRVRTRQQARGLETHEGKPIPLEQRGRVPDIIITNYSMLEYMLCRPQDAIFFGPALRAIVLDEAHLYTGTLAAEITLLLRRLLIRCERQAQQVLQIATSATLGSDRDDDLRSFAARLFSKAPANVYVIKGELEPLKLAPADPPSCPPTAATLTQRSWLDQPPVVRDEKGAPRLRADRALCERLREQLPALVGQNVMERIDPAEDRLAVLLHSALRAAPLVHRLAELLWRRVRLPLCDLATELWGDPGGDSERATVELLQLAASARLEAESHPLVPHRIHLMVRPSDGLTACLNPECGAPAERKLPPLGGVATGATETCAYCGSATLALFHCRNCGDWLLAGEEQDKRLRPAIHEGGNVRLFTLKEVPGQGRVTVTRQGELAGAGAAGPMVSVVSACPTCGAGTQEIQAFDSMPALTLSIVAETILAKLPELPSEAKHWLPARGRRLLAFSDSRSEAARLGPRLTRQHETQLVRAAITNALRERPVGDEQALRLARGFLEQIESQLAQPGLTAGMRQFLEKQRRDLQQQIAEFEVGASLHDWAEAIAHVPVLAEILDPESGLKHDARWWSQNVWKENHQQVQKTVARLLAREFASPLARASSAETLGLAEVTYPGLDRLEAPASLLGKLPREEVRQKLWSCWTDLLAALCDTLRVDGVITTGDDEEDRAYQFGPILIGRWCAEDKERGFGLVRFVGERPDQRRRAFVAAVLQAAGLSAGEAVQLAPEVLREAFRQIHAAATPHTASGGHEGAFLWLRRHLKQTKQGPPADAIQLFLPKLGLRRPRRLFRCRVTGQVWVRSVLGCAPAQGSSGTLEPVSEEELDNDPRLRRQRREYRESPVFQIGLWAEEHSAQLASKETRRLQDLFKAGIRNVLSATTTLELGIDIGGLNAVLMANVPPGKANYLQRAGRAGRRADGSSAVVTFARPSPFDREVFLRIGDYLDRPLRRPLVLLDRERIVRRHLHSFLLGEFFRAIYPPSHHVGAMNAFGNMGVFCGVPLPPKWEKGQSQKPLLQQPALGPTNLTDQFVYYLVRVRDQREQELRRCFETLFEGTEFIGRINEWQDLLDHVIADFERAVKEWRADYDTLLRAWEEAGARVPANAIRYQLAAQYELTVIEALADRQFLPHYGFPIGVHKLRVIAPDVEHGGRVREEDQYRLERSSLLALREYVPGSQLLVGGKVISSRGVLRHWTGANLDTAIGFRGRYTHCTNGHFYYYFWGKSLVEPCPICSAPPSESPRELLFLKYGFTSAAWDPPKWSIEVERVGNVQTASITLTSVSQNEPAPLIIADFGGVIGLQASYRDGGELLVYNEGEKGRGFAICLKCGYAESETQRAEGRLRLPREFERHAPVDSGNFWRWCWNMNEAPVLRNQTLAARETTDLLLLDFSRTPAAARLDRPLVTTLGYALRRAGAQLFELDPRELGVMAAPAGEAGHSLGVLLYDAIAGGAGHVREILEYGRDWLAMARDMLFVSYEHDKRCETACLDCLLSFDAQEAMSRNLLHRRAALAVLECLLQGIPCPASVGEQPELAASQGLPAGGQALPLMQPSNEERLRRARERRQGRA